MEKATKKKKPTYWAVYHGKEIEFDGTFTECWDWMIKTYIDETIAFLQEHNICVARKA